MQCRDSGSVFAHYSQGITNLGGSILRRGLGKVFTGAFQVRFFNSRILYTFRKHKLVILVVATTGEGDATDNAKSFNRFLASKSTSVDSFVGLKYCVFGLGDLNYINFNHMGKRTERNMERLGAIRIHPRGIGDASQDIEADLRHWIDSGLLSAIRDHFPNLRRTGSKPVFVLSGVSNLLQMVVSDGVQETHIEASASATTLSKVYYTLKPIEIVSRRILSEFAFELTLKIPSSEIAESIEILPANSQRDIEWAMSQFAGLYRLDQVVSFVSKDPPFPVPCTLLFALTHYIDISTLGSLSRTFLANLATLLGNHELEDLVVTHMSFKQFWIKYSEQFELTLGMSEFLQIAPKQKIRPYTQAGNFDNAVRIIVAPVSDGVCSDYLCHEVEIGDKILARTRPSVFSSHQTSYPLLAIVTGAGIAPFMSIMASNPDGAIHLIFGCRGLDDGFLYKDEILEWQAQGRITCHFAFSRSEEPEHFAFSRGYVQDIVKGDKEVHRLIDSIAAGPEGRIIVCGRTAMGRSVCDAIAGQLGGQIQLEQLATRGALAVEYFG